MMSLQVRLVVIFSSCVMLLVIFDLIRRQRLRARYSLFWLFVGFVFLVFSIWSSLLNRVGAIIGVYSPTNALFVVGFAGIVIILLHFSVIISSLSVENKKLIQRLSILSWQMEELERRRKAGLSNGEG